MVIVLEAQLAITPAGRPVATPIPDAPVVICVILVSAVFTHISGAEEAALTVLSELIVMVPLAFKVSQPPVNGMM